MSLRKTEEETYTQRGKGHVKMKAETGVMQPQLKNPCLEPSEAGRGRILPEPSEGAWSSQHLEFSLLASRPGRGYFSVVLSLPVCGHLYGNLKELTHYPLLLSLALSEKIFIYLGCTGS